MLTFQRSIWRFWTNKSTACCKRGTMKSNMTTLSAPKIGFLPLFGFSQSIVCFSTKKTSTDNCIWNLFGFRKFDDIVRARHTCCNCNSTIVFLSLVNSSFGKIYNGSLDLLHWDTWTWISQKLQIHTMIFLPCHVSSSLSLRLNFGS